MNEYLRINQSIANLFHSTVILTNATICTARAEGFWVEKFLAQPWTIVPRPVVDPYIDDATLLSVTNT